MHRRTGSKDSRGRHRRQLSRQSTGGSDSKDSGKGTKTLSSRLRKQRNRTRTDEFLRGIEEGGYKLGSATRHLQNVHENVYAQDRSQEAGGKVVRATLSNNVLPDRPFGSNGIASFAGAKPQKRSQLAHVPKRVGTLVDVKVNPPPADNRVTSMPSQASSIASQSSVSGQRSMSTTAARRTSGSTQAIGDFQRRGRNRVRRNTASRPRLYSHLVEDAPPARPTPPPEEPAAPVRNMFSGLSEQSDSQSVEVKPVHKKRSRANSLRQRAPSGTEKETVKKNQAKRRWKTLKVSLMLRALYTQRTQEMDEVRDNIARIAKEKEIVTDPTKMKGVPLHKRGDFAMYENEALSQRNINHKDLRLYRAVAPFWNLASANLMSNQKDAAKRNMVHQEEYLAMNVRLYKALIKDFNDIEAVRSGMEDWQRDTARISEGNQQGATSGKHASKYLPFEAFYHSMYELADNWTSSTEPEEYESFLAYLFGKITITKADGKTYWRELDDIEFSDDEEDESHYGTLFEAITNRSHEAVMHLLKKGANPNERKFEGEDATPLHCVARVGGVPICRTLLQYKADVLIPDDDKRIPLHIAIRNNRTDVARVLLSVEKEAQLAAVDHLGRTALHYACIAKNVNLVELLLQAGANPNVQDVAGNTCMHAAVLGGSSDVIGLLLENGVNLSERNADGLTACDLAEKRGNGDIENWLRREEAVQRTRSPSVSIRSKGSPLSRKESQSSLGSARSRPTSAHTTQGDGSNVQGDGDGALAGLNDSDFAGGQGSHALLQDLSNSTTMTAEEKMRAYLTNSDVGSTMRSYFEEDVLGSGNPCRITGVAVQVLPAVGKRRRRRGKRGKNGGVAGYLVTVFGHEFHPLSHVKLNGVDYFDFVYTEGGDSDQPHDQNLVTFYVPSWPSPTQALILHELLEAESLYCSHPEVKQDMLWDVKDDERPENAPNVISLSRSDGVDTDPFLRPFRFLYPKKGSALFKPSKKSKGNGRFTDPASPYRNGRLSPPATRPAKATVTSVKRMGFGQGVVTRIRTPGKIREVPQAEDIHGHRSPTHPPLSPRSSPGKSPRASPVKGIGFTDFGHMDGAYEGSPLIDLHIPRTRPMSASPAPSTIQSHDGSPVPPTSHPMRPMSARSVSPDTAGRGSGEDHQPARAQSRLSSSTIDESVAGSRPASSRSPRKHLQVRFEDEDVSFSFPVRDFPSTEMRLSPRSGSPIVEYTGLEDAEYGGELIHPDGSTLIPVSPIKSEEAALRAEQRRLDAEAMRSAAGHAGHVVGLGGGVGGTSGPRALRSTSPTSPDATPSRRGWLTSPRALGPRDDPTAPTATPLAYRNTKLPPEGPKVHGAWGHRGPTASPEVRRLDFDEEREIGQAAVHAALESRPVFFKSGAPLSSVAQYVPRARGTDDGTQRGLLYLTRPPSAPSGPPTIPSPRRGRDIPEYSLSPATRKHPAVR